jgi:hypothetical protein
MQDYGGPVGFAWHWRPERVEALIIQTLWRNEGLGANWKRVAPLGRSRCERKRFAQTCYRRRQRGRVTWGTIRTWNAMILILTDEFAF